MAGLVERLRADRIAAIKGRRELERNLLGTLLAAATREAKAPDDAAVVRTMRSFLKANHETATALDAAGQDGTAVLAERALLERYLPSAVGEAELEAAVAEIVAGLPERSPKLIGRVMAELRERYGEALDARLASDVTRRALSS